MQLSRRLAALVQYVPPNTIIADIGTDHAQVPVYLVKNGICFRAVAGDLNSGPVESARETVRLYGLEEKIDIRQGDGLEIVKPGEVDVVIAAGMGGLLMTRILERGREVLKSLQRLVVQPNNNPGLLRSWLVKNGWGIVDEELVQESGKFYPVIVAEQNRGSYAGDSLSLEIGPCLLKKGGPLVQKFLEKKKRDYSKILDTLSKSSNSEAAKKKKEIEKLLAGVKEVLNGDRES